MENKKFQILIIKDNDYFYIYIYCSCCVIVIKKLIKFEINFLIKIL